MGILLLGELGSMETLPGVRQPLLSAGRRNLFNRVGGIESAEPGQLLTPSDDHRVHVHVAALCSHQMG